MAEVLGANIPLPSFGIGTGFIWLIAIMILLICVGIFGVWLLYRFKVYNKKIIVFENISGQGYQPVYRDRAKTVKLGAQGEELLYLAKKKVYRTAYGRKMGKNTYWFAIGQDGYWYNYVLGDVDSKMGMLDIEPIDRDMRYMHVAVRKNIQDRYRKIKFMEKYGTLIMVGFFTVVMIVGIWMLLDKMADIAATTAGNIGASEQVQIATKNILASLDNLCGGAGIRPAV